MILNDIADKKRNRLERTKKEYPLSDFMLQSLEMPPKTSFRGALEQRGLSIIGEIKKASPSKGLIKDPFHPVQLALQYAGNVEGISVLTEEDYFLGSNSYLARVVEHLPMLPFLRKDFIIDEYQIYESKILGASAFLLISELLDLETLKKFIGLGNMLGMDALVEAHDAENLYKAQEAGANIIGINNRNLKTFQVSLKTTIDLAKEVDKKTLLVSESGINTKEDIEFLSQVRMDAILVGETFMRAKSIEEKAAELRSGYHEYKD
ncbi:indole-3-glycerol phosphate synthase TrpC [Clostridia bacterium]|nr:indole-3-glycerol phosphate synthase TrpC [Clostridia bacterium]